MTALKTLILIFLAINSSRSESYFVHHRLHRPKPKVVPTTVDITHNDNSRCICIHKGPISVTELFNSNDKIGLKRLVIYLYKDTEQDILKMYTPHEEFQVQFPDFGVDDGDLINVGYETVNEVFGENPNTIEYGQVQNLFTEHPPTAVNNNQDLDSTVFNAPEISDYTHNYENEMKNPTEYYTDQSPISLDYYLPDKYINQYDKIINEINTDVSSDYVNIENFPAKEFQAEYDISSPKYDGLDVNNPQRLSVDIVSKPTEEASIHNSVNAIDPNELHIPVETNNDPETYLYQILNTDTTSELNLQPSVAIHDYTASDDVPNVKLIKQTKTNANQQDVDDYYVTFDIWFAKQMQNIQKTDPNEKVDLSSLKNLIEKSLYENGLFVTKDGVLTDSKANILDVDNLKLRPILIGDSVAYNNVFADNKYELPSNLAYLESVLVTLINPPKLLGVIPVRTTFVPRMSYRKGLDYWAWKARNNFSNCTTLECVIKLQQRENQNNGEYNQIEDWHKQPEISEEQISNNNNLNVNEEISKLDRYKKYRFNWKKLLDAFQNALVNVNDRNPRISKIDIRKKPVDDQISEDEKLELPGFRIIGGYPATSSGTPVNNKGRAGQIFS